MHDREMLSRVTKALEDLSFECFGVIGTTRPSVETYNRAFGVLEEARAHVKAPPLSEKLWLWKNFVDGKPEFWAFDNPFPIHLDNGDPQTLGEPCGYALFKPSRQGRTDVSEEQVIARIKGAK